MWFTDNPRIMENLQILFLLGPLTVLSAWWLVRLINWSTGTGKKLHEIMATIYSNPVAAAIYRVGILCFVLGLISLIYGRFV